jgi:hypothetical protein
MNEEPATRAPNTPCAPQTPAPASGKGAAGPDASAERTALRGRLADALHKAAYVCPGDSCPLTEDECQGEHGITLLSIHLSGAREIAWIEGNTDAITDTLLPVVEEALAEQTHRAEQARILVDALLATVPNAEDLATVQQVTHRTLLRIRAALDADQPKEVPDA